MQSIDVKDLQERTAELLREVREKATLYVVSSGGEPVALLSPVTVHLPREGEERQARAAGDGWERYADLAGRLRGKWPADRTSQSLLDDVRR